MTLNNITPLRRQYLDIKSRYGDCLLLFRIGDFYEAFDEDASLLARELDIVLTSKPMGKSGRIPLAGVPHHSLERHLRTLIARGFRVAICEQLSDASVKQGGGGSLMERGVVRVVTPGTILEPALLSSKANNFLAAIYVERQRAGIAYADVTTGEFAATEINFAEAMNELQRIAPAEVLIPQSATLDATAFPINRPTRCPDDIFNFRHAERAVLEHFNATTLQAFGLRDKPLAVRAAGSLLSYLRDTATNAAEALTRLAYYDTENFMVLDASAQRSLEIFESGTPAGTLLFTLDRTRTSFGGRLLRRWLRRPLLDRLEIARRHDHVEWFVSHKEESDNLAESLGCIHDLERLSARARTNLASPHEIWTLGESLAALPRARAILQKDARAFGALLTALPACAEIQKLIERAIADGLTRKSTQNHIRDGFSDELDRLRALLRDSKRELAAMETRERARTGIKSLRVSFNKVFGYYIEVTRPNLHLVPENYTRKQTLANAERFITLELKEHESLVVHAEDRIAELEVSLFRQVCAEIGRARTEITGAAATLAYLDCIRAFAEIAREWHYTRPHIADDAELRFTEMRHPVLEQSLGRDSFVGNDLALGGASMSSDAPQIALITGPNMSGKSTFMRAAALCVMMAQTGSFVPAREAHVGICDRIWTRTGLYDRIGSRESTFMTEMLETAQILHGATPRSLVLLDELGRGTSTYDGLSVARAVLEYIHNHPRLSCKTLFATHYHELTLLESLLPRLKNFCVAIAERDDELEFLYKVTHGTSGRSYGVYAARLAGLPAPVVRRAEALLAEYETANPAAKHSARALHPASLTTDESLAKILAELDLDALSPVEALMKLYELRQIAVESELKTEVDVRPIRTA